MTTSSRPPGMQRHRSNAFHSKSSKCVKIIPALLLCLERMQPLGASATTFRTSETSPPSNPRPFGADAVETFIRNRCGSTDADDIPAVWSYEGTLTDPMTGKVIAEVEGLELVTPLPTIEPPQLADDEDDRFPSRKGLSVKGLLRQNAKSPTPPWDAATTVLSRRLFCYKRPSSSNPKNVTPNPNSKVERNRHSPYDSLLTSLRLRPNGPLRPLSPAESVAVYDSAITYVSRNGGREMAVFSERGGIAEDEDETRGGRARHYVMGSAARSYVLGKGGSPTGFDFVVHAQRGTLNGKSDDGGPLLPPLKMSSVDRNGSEDVVISPPRSQFFQFGKGDGNGSRSKQQHGSVRETYAYSFDDQRMEGGGGFSNSTDSTKANQHKLLNLFGRTREQMGRKTTKEEHSRPQSQCSVCYTRYGEAPPWYAPGRPCTLELKGERLALPPSADVPGECANPLTSWAASKCNFWSGWPAIFLSRNGPAKGTDLARQYYQLPPRSESELAQQAVELFCNEKQLSIGPLDDYPADERKRWLTSVEDALSKMQSCCRRVSKSFIASEVPKRNEV